MLILTSNIENRHKITINNIHEKFTNDNIADPFAFGRFIPDDQTDTVDNSNKVETNL